MKIEQDHSIDQTARYLENHFAQYLSDLKKLVKIPSISFPGFSASELHKSADAVVELMQKYGLENVRILKIKEGHPYIVGERLRSPHKPTLLLYAHHDVQPPGRENIWESPPFEPTEKLGPGGQRLYGRGAADDKAGIIVHLAAIDSYLKVLGELPVNVKVVIEGEEEIGSTHLSEFLEVYSQDLQADVIVLTDTGNFDCGIPALTTSLRGLVAVEVELKALSKTIHSGMWGGPIPDPAMGLAKLLATLVDDSGEISIPGILDQVKPILAEEKKELAAIPFNETEFRKQSGMLPHIPFLRNDPTPIVQVWRLPSLTVNAIQASSRLQAGNIINDSAWAKITLRLVADMDPAKVLSQLIQHLKSHVPWGLEIAIKPEACNGPWSIEAKGPVFDAAEKALEKGYGKTPYKIGTGGSIPFVKPFAEALGGVPVLLVGVEDPYTNAHGENESILLKDLKSACLSQIYLFGELAQL